MSRSLPFLFGLAVVGLTAAFLAKWLGWLDVPSLVDTGVATVGLFGLVLLVKLPWDLYMEARGLVADQRDAVGSDIVVSDEERRYAKRTARRLLGLCIGLHVVTATVVAAATWASQGYLGYWFAGFYLLATFFRPAVAFYRHMIARLRELRDRTRHPREDVQSIRLHIAELEEADRVARDEHVELAAALERLSRRVDALDREQRVRTAAFEDQVALCLRELERTVDKLTDDRELLAGIRAFVKVVKQT